jgi:putative polyketide hydroxylase
MLSAMTTTPVLIVGAGPAGLVTAITLARQGIATLLVERRATTSPFPRATGISTRTMELIRSWGLEEHVRAGEMDVATQGWVCRSLAAPEGMAVSLGMPTPEQARAASPTGPAAVPQDHLEPVLLAHLRTYQNATVRFGVELVDLTQDADGVTAVLREHRSHRHTTVRCTYVVGADGAHSAVRTSLGIVMQGPDNLGDLLAVLFRAPLAEVVGERRYGLYMLQGSADIEVFLPAGDGDRWLYSRTWSPTAEGWTDYPAERLVQLIRTGSGAPDLPVHILRINRFQFAAQVAERFRDGRAFLLGDAAHRMTPRGGTGMNTAIHAAHDLGWKLGWVLRGWAPADLLDTYEAERRPIGVRNTANSAQPNRPDPNAFANDLGGRLPHVWQGTGRSTLDLVGPGRTLLAGPDGAGWRSADVGAGAPVEFRVVDAAAAEAFGIGRDGAVLVRPDGQVTARWPSARATLRAA